MTASPNPVYARWVPETPLSDSCDVQNERADVSKPPSQRTCNVNPTTFEVPDGEPNVHTTQQRTRWWGRTMRSHASCQPKLCVRGYEIDHLEQEFTGEGLSIWRE